MKIWIIIFVVLLCFINFNALTESQKRCPTCGQIIPEGQKYEGKTDIGRTDQYVEPSERGISDVKEKGSINNLDSLLKSRLFLGIIILLLMAIAMLIIYFLIFVPRKKRRLLLEAIQIIQDDNVNKFQDAEKMLNKALTSGLKENDIAEARFAIAYIRARLGQFSEALAVLSDLKDTGKIDKETIYLSLWLQCREKNYDEVENIYNQYGDDLDDLLNTKVIFGIAFLNKARVYWSRREIDEALRYFDLLRKLDVLSEEIPKHIDNHLIVFGIISIFEKDFEEASKHFEKAKEDMEKSGKPAYPAEIGLLLHEWRKNGQPNIDDKLKQIINDIRANIEKANTKIVKAQSDKDGKSIDDDQKEKDYETLLLRNCLLWYSISLLYLWLMRPKNLGLKEEDFKELDERLDQVKEIDPEMGDPYMINGLISYYFSQNDMELRKKALEELELSTSKDVNIPDVIDLIEREKKLDELYRKGLARFLMIVKEWLQDPGIPEQLRKELKYYLVNSLKLTQLDMINITTDDESPAPSVADMQLRSETLRRRINSIVRPRMRKDEDVNQVNRTIVDLDEAVRTLTDNVGNVEKIEKELMIVVGQFLLKEEENYDASDLG